MATVPIGIVTLSTAGVVRTPNEKIDRLMSYFFQTQHSQSNETRAHNVSCQELIMKHGSYPSQLAAEMQKKLVDYFGRYFPATDIEVIADDSDNGGAYGIVIRGSVTEVDGKKYTIAESLEASGDTFRRLMKLNNG